ncbi:hypothetical protein G7Z17_g4552 [Cylindrodendrum hubeiense]|uniref:Major facilitator superfamily (MFS) profile domain-containing protein n=1 Tax=Cylindrodendrum hubeiense TaxID=595255 RepID=A0A9P5H8J8_9HYPO|nr:hypothetical protein G7Z17_g4552 [Cylindrodendrum hubeiense]
MAPTLSGHELISSRGGTPRSCDEKGETPTRSGDESTSGLTEVDDAPQYVHGLRLALIVTGLILTVFCLGLDNSILATAIPSITNEFKSLEDVAWYGSSYLLTTCCFQLIYGKLYAEFKITWVFLAALGIFELGSIICAAAPNSIALVIGRAVAGIGCAGLLSGALTIIAESLPVHKRPIYTGAIGGTSGIAQIIAPTLGGVFTDRATWRWCFWINLPFGAITAIIILFFVKMPDRTKRNKTVGIRNFLIQMDVPGTLILMPFMICLLLGLQWGGTTYAWTNWRRSVACSALFTLGMSGALFVIVYYVPIWFQAVRNTTAEQSGINFLTASGAMSVAAVVGGVLTTKIGYYVPQMIFSSILCAISGGLILQYDLDTSTGYWIGTLIMFGFAAGMGLQMPFTAIQTIFQGPDIPLATSIIILAQSISGTIFLAVGQNLFQSSLLKKLASGAPEVDAKGVIAHGVSNLFADMQEQYSTASATEVLKAYNGALQKCLMLCVILASISLLGAVGMEWKSVKPKKADEATES